VLAVGDEEFQNRCAERFAELRAEGRTIVVVSHSLGSIQSICDEVAWLDGGVLRSSGPAGDVVDEYLTEVHRQRGGALPATTGRWGSQEIVLEEMEVLDGDGGEHGLPLRTGGSAVFRFHYRADGPVPRPMFTLAIHTLDGTTITNPSTHEPPAVPGDLNGAGHIDLVVDRLPLLPGTYDLSGAITDDAALHVYDHRHRALRFDVESAIPRQSSYGLVSFNGRWELHADER